MQREKSWQGKTDGGSFGQRFILFLCRYTDVRIAYVFAALSVPFYMLFKHRNRQAIYRYFRKQWHYGRCRSLWATYRNHLVFAEMMMDRFACYAGRGAQFKVTVDRQDLFDRMTADEPGFILCGAHVGNFELAGYLMHQDRKTLFGLVYDGESPVVQQQRMRLLDRNRVELIPVKADMSHLFRLKQAIDEGHIVSMPCDRIWGSSKYFRCRFLQGESKFPAGAFTLAAKLGRPMLALFVMRSGSRSYTIYVRPVEVDRQTVKQQDLPSALADAYVKHLEEIVRRYPLQWFNFYDFWAS